MADSDGDGEGDANTWMNALIGAAVTVVLSFVPFSSVLGGGVAGYLQRGDSREGAVVGALSGVLAAVPSAIFLFFLGSVFVFGMMRGGPRGLLFGGFGALILLFLAAYLVGLSALGGFLGAYVATETDVGG